MSKTRNPIELLEHKLRKRFRAAAVSLDRPAKKQGTWFLDIERNGHRVVVQWKEGRGFGVSCSQQHIYGEGADEVYQELEAAFARVVCLLIECSYSSPPLSVRMAELRRERGVSQESLAALLDVKQAAISKMEHRQDALVSSVREIVRSLGGELRLIATFPDGMERVLELVEESSTVAPGRPPILTPRQPPRAENTAPPRR